MHQAPTVLLVLATLFIAACSEAPEAPELAETAREAQATSAIGKIDDARIKNADSEPGNWLAHGRTYEEQRFSPLKQINKETVKRPWPGLVQGYGHKPSTRINADRGRRHYVFHPAPGAGCMPSTPSRGKKSGPTIPKCLASGVVVDAVMSSIAALLCTKERSTSAVSTGV